MPTYSLPYGFPVTLLQNTPYAMPAKACYLVSDVALEGAFNIAGPWTTAIGNSKPEGALSVASFVRCPTGTANVVVKRA